MYLKTNEKLESCKDYKNSNTKILEYTNKCLISFVLGGICPAGHFCPSASPRPVPCTLGKYCARLGLHQPSDNCSAGYYCNESSTVPNQYHCPMGHFCPQGTGTPVSCPAGTFSNTTRNTKQDDCQQCKGKNKS